MRIAFTIDTAKENAFARAGVSARGYRFGFPAVDLRQHRFHFRLAELIFRIPPIERAQRLIERIV